MIVSNFKTIQLNIIFRLETKYVFQATLYRKYRISQLFSILISYCYIALITQYLQNIMIFKEFFQKILSKSFDIVLPAVICLILKFT